MKSLFDISQFYFVHFSFLPFNSSLQLNTSISPVSYAIGVHSKQAQNSKKKQYRKHPQNILNGQAKGNVRRSNEFASFLSGKLQDLAQFRYEQRQPYRFKGVMLTIFLPPVFLQKLPSFSCQCSFTRVNFGFWICLVF